MDFNLDFIFGTGMGMALLFHPNPYGAGFWLVILGIVAIILVLVFAFDGFEKISNAKVRISRNRERLKKNK